MPASRRFFFLSILIVSLSVNARGADPFPGTQPLTETKPLDHVMLEGMERYLTRNTAAAREERLQTWTKALAERATAEEFRTEQRKKLATVLGVLPATQSPGIEFLSSTTEKSLLHKGTAGEIHRVRWPVLEGVTAEGLLLQPAGAPLARVVAIPDADWTPEMFSGVQSGVVASAQLPRRLWEAGCQVLVPTLISRADTYSGNPEFRMTNQPHREFIHRQAFEMGRTLIGYEVQKVLAAINQFASMNEAEKRSVPFAVAGISEGGLIALNAAALDPRIQSAYIAGYFQAREGLVDEPIYRNVWRSLRQAGDAELAALIAPRDLFIEACGVPEVSGPPAVKSGRAGGAAPGKIETCTLALVRKEVDRGKAYYQQLDAPGKLRYAASGEGDGPAGSGTLWASFLEAVGAKAGPSTIEQHQHAGSSVDDARQKRQFTELVDYTQKIFRHSHKDRDKLWSKASRKSVAEWEKACFVPGPGLEWKPVGRMPAEQLPFNVRTRQVLDEPAYRGYEVLLDVEQDIVATGILLWPKDVKPGEKRPVVVCQHGLEGGPDGHDHPDGKGSNTTSPSRTNSPIGDSLPTHLKIRIGDRPGSARFSERPIRWGYRCTVSSSRSTSRPSRGWPRCKGLIRNESPSMASRMAARRRSRPDDAHRILPLHLLGDFNEWVLKNVSVDAAELSLHSEYEIFEWNMGFIANYAELAYLMTPARSWWSGDITTGFRDEWVAGIRQGASMLRGTGDSRQDGDRILPRPTQDQWCCHLRVPAQASELAKSRGASQPISSHALTSFAQAKGEDRTAGGTRAGRSPWDF
ncbi:MAG: hypothetical protein U0903_00770 [Planctomycetales bacterium]